MGEAAENYSTEVESFLDALYGEQTGYSYVPTKGESGYWQEYYFKWPQHRQQILTHILAQTGEKDCYVSPSLFKAPSNKRQAWKGSQFTWVEFDGNAPKTLPPGIPAPTIKIQSSEPGHEHWYWKFAEFVTDFRALEGLSKQLAYTLDSDKSGWECNQVLRPPGTIHQESKKRVRVIGTSTESVGFASFKDLVVAPEPVVLGSNFTEVPDVQDVVAKFKWPKEATEIFKKTFQPVGSRSSAMTALGFFCIEMGMSNEEAYSILYNADERWGKYKNRSAEDRAKRLIGIISHCRSKKELDAELHLSERESFVSLGDFRKTEVRAKWLYTNFLTEQGLGVVSASPGVGKSTFSIRFGIATVLKKDFLLWKNAADSGKRVGFVSLEMAGVECKKFIEDMWPSFSDAEKATLDKNFFLLPLGYSLALGNKDAQQMLLDEIDNHHLDFIIIDSLKAATGLDEKKMDAFFDWINKYVRGERKCTVWLIHHNRKAPNEGPRKPRGLEDLYGDTFIGAHPTAVIILWRKSKTVLEVIPVKIRLAEETESFTIKREPHLNFSVDQEKVDRHNDSESDESGESDSRTRLFG